MSFYIVPDLDDVAHEGNSTSVPLNVPAIEHQTTYTPTGNEPVGTTFWEGHGLVTVYENGARLNHGFELYTFGTDEGNDFPEGSAVSVKGATGNRVAFELTDISDNESVINYIGLLTTPVDSGNRLATREGAVNGLKTDYTGTGAWGTTWAEGDQIYVGSVPGVLTNEQPTSGRVIRVGTVTVVHQNQGVIELDRMITPSIEEVINSGTTIEVTTPYTAEEINSFLVVRNPVSIQLPEITKQTEIIITNKSNGSITVIPFSGNTVHDDSELIIRYRNSTVQLKSFETEWIVV